MPKNILIRPTHLTVNLTRLKENVAAIRAAVAPAQVLVMLKANAYGHGVDGVAPFIAPYVDYIGVALLEEGIAIRKLGVDKPILVAGGTLPEQVPYFLEYDLTLPASSPLLLSAAEEAAAATGKKLKAHLKIDTGMERVGVRPGEARPFIEQSLRLKHVDVEGIYTHFANSETLETPDMERQPFFVYASQQLERFNEVLSLYEKLNAPAPRIRHTANSAAICNLPDSYFDMVRAGVMFYGVYPDVDVKRDILIKPALTWKSQVVYSKLTAAGQPVSYGSLWHGDHDVRIVTVPCGYADGYFRRMTNRPQIIVNGKKYQQVGRICMDQFMVNLEADSAELGDEVILLGEAASGERVVAEDLAEWAGTNPYEVMTNISARVPRVFVDDERRKDER